MQIAWIVSNSKICSENNNNKNIRNNLKEMAYHFAKVISLQIAFCCAFSQGYVIDKSIGKKRKEDVVRI